jgi:two-component system OmpR family sensor kinase
MRLPAVGEGWRRAPLWLRLLAVVMLLLVASFGVTGYLATRLMHRYLVNRVDQQLSLTAGRFRRPPPPSRTGGEDRPRLPSEFFVAWLDPQGKVQDKQLQPLTEGQTGPDLARLTPTAIHRHGNAPFTLPASGAGGPWRVRLEATDDGSTRVVAISLEDVNRTFHRLVTIILLVGASGVVVLAGVGYLLVRATLRPLVEIETTAETIAKGDLSRRVPSWWHPATEVGRLGTALNEMLGQIEEAFRAREASEGAARASEERMRQFVADASHELRTPLTSIRGFAELYRQGAVRDEPGVARLLSRIEDEAARMGVLVEDLLLLARLDTQRPLQSKPVDLTDLVTEAVHDARMLTPDRTISLEPVAHPLVVTGDRARLRQVLDNLVGNAVTHTPAGTPVTVRLAERNGDRPPVAVLEVADEGPGLTEEQARRVFERFYRVDTSRSRVSGGGTGLGLAIVHALATAHAGTVELDTAPGTGSTFRVLLPLPPRGFEKSLG